MRDREPEEPQPYTSAGPPPERSSLDRAEEAAHVRRLYAERQAQIARSEVTS